MKISLLLLCITIVIISCYAQETKKVAPQSAIDEPRPQWNWGTDDDELLRPTTREPTRRPTTREPTRRPTTRKPTRRPTRKPTRKPTRLPTTKTPITPSTFDSSTISTTTAASGQYTTCFTSCPHTQQYNPVCGTDKVTYRNIAQLKCAQNCGLNVQELFQGKCT